MHRRVVDVAAACEGGRRCRRRRRRRRRLESGAAAFPPLAPAAAAARSARRRPCPVARTHVARVVSHAGGLPYRQPRVLIRHDVPGALCAAVGRGTRCWAPAAQLGDPLRRAARCRQLCALCRVPCCPTHVLHRPSPAPPLTLQDALIKGHISLNVPRQRVDYCKRVPLSGGAHLAVNASCELQGALLWAWRRAGAQLHHPGVRGPACSAAPPPLGPRPCPRRRPPRRACALASRPAPEARLAGHSGVWHAQQQRRQRHLGAPR